MGKIKFFGVIISAVCCILFTSCSGEKSKPDIVNLKLAHNLSGSHPFAQIMEKFAKNVKEKSHGKLNIILYPNSVLGPDRTVIEQLQGGVVEMMKAGSSSMESFNPVFSIFSLPYLFKDKDHFDKAMSGKIIDQLNEITTKRDHFRILTYFTTGIRSFYTRHTPILKPSDLKGLKIRVMESKTSLEMIKLMGGTPTPMPYGEIYTALQQGIIDGAENNPTALTIGKQGEVAKAYSFDNHLMMPDLLLISEDTWENDLSPSEQKILLECAREATKEYKVIWEKSVEDAIENAKENMDVKFYYPDIEPFKKKVQPLYKEFEKDPVKKKLIKEIQNTK